MPYRKGSQLPGPGSWERIAAAMDGPWCLALGRPHRSDPCSAGATCAASASSYVTAISRAASASPLLRWTESGAPAAWRLSA